MKITTQKIRNSLMAVGALLLPLTSIAGEPAVNYHAFSHNDYLHSEPLMGAIKNRFGAVEADVWLIDGELYLGHEKPEIPSECTTLETMYLEPLRKMVKENGGSVYQGSKQPFYLLIDQKGDDSVSQATYLALSKKLEEYKDILTRYEDGKVIPGAVSVFTSPSALEDMLSQKVRYAAIDGNMDYLDKNLPTSLMPWISINFELALGREDIDWDAGTQNFRLASVTDEELQHALDVIKEVKRQGRLTRLWWVPEHKEFWEWQMEAGVNLIATDDLKGMNQFMSQLDN